MSLMPELSPLIIPFNDSFIFELYSLLSDLIFVKKNDPYLLISRSEIAAYMYLPDKRKTSNIEKILIFDIIIVSADLLNILKSKNKVYIFTLTVISI